GLRPAHAGEVWVAQPALQVVGDAQAASDTTAGTLRMRPQQPALRLQLVPKPGEGLVAETGTALLVEVGRVPALAAAGPDGGPGGVVAVAGRRADKQVRVGGEDLGEPAGRLRKPSLVRQNLPGAVQDPVAESPLVCPRAGDARGVAGVRLVQAAEVVGR